MHNWHRHVALLFKGFQGFTKAAQRNVGMEVESYNRPFTLFIGRVGPISSNQDSRSIGPCQNELLAHVSMILFRAKSDHSSKGLSEQGSVHVVHHNINTEVVRKGFHLDAA